MPTSALISAAVERNACPNPLFGYTAPLDAAYPVKLIRCSSAIVFVASRAFAATGFTLLAWLAASHCARAEAVVPLPPMVKLAGFGIGSDFGPPDSVCGRPPVKLRPRNGALARSGALVARCRPSQPPPMRGSRGLPTSMYRCASKCDRELSTDPVACATSKSPLVYAGINGSMPGEKPKKLSSATALGPVPAASGRAMAMFGRPV